MSCALQLSRLFLLSLWLLATTSVMLVLSDLFGFPTFNANAADNLTPHILLQKAETCDNILEKIAHHKVSVPTVKQLQLQGVWISQRCEVRPGPEYILRRYNFINNTHFQILQFYYMDPFCSRPFYGLAANGILTQMERRDSWILAEAIEAPRPNMLQVQVMPYTYQAAIYLQNRASKSNNLCKLILSQQKLWQPRDGPFVILSYVEYSRHVLRDLDCTSGVGFNLHEFRLIRLQMNHMNKESKGLIERNLFLGGLATLFSQRATFSPTSFQAPLDDVRNLNCRLCRSLRTANLKQPPELNDHLLVTEYPFGEWISQLCESRHGSTFITRRFLFENDKKTWHVYYYFFRDVRCQRPYITIYATGKCNFLNLSRDNLDSQNFDFYITRARVIPRDLQALAYFNGYRGLGCGVNGQWVINVGQDVSATGGCELLQLQVPEEVPQILRIERTRFKYLLFLGEMPNSGESKALRPTSFQPPLIRCRETVSSVVEGTDYLSTDSSMTTNTNDVSEFLYSSDAESKRDSHPELQEQFHTMFSFSLKANGATITFISIMVIQLY